MVEEVSDASGTESAARRERSHLFYNNPLALNHGHDLQWSRISHRDYTDLECVTQGHFFLSHTNRPPLPPRVSIPSEVAFVIFSL